MIAVAILTLFAAIASPKSDASDATVLPFEVGVAVRAAVPGRVEVRLRDSDDKAVQGAEVSIVPALPENWDTPACTCVTGADGTATFESAGESSFEAIIEPPAPLSGGYYFFLRPNDQALPGDYPVPLISVRSHCSLGIPPGLNTRTQAIAPMGFANCRSFGPKRHSHAPNSKP